MYNKTNCPFAAGTYPKWFVGNDLRDILLADEDIVAQVKNNIYPLIAPENTYGDFIIYQREKYNRTDSKIGIAEDVCQVSLVAISDNYDNAVLLASKIDSALSGKHIDKEEGLRLSISLANASEQFEDNKYLEVLLFEIR